MGYRLAGAAVVLALVAAESPPPSGAETRDYRILIDGREAGTSRITIARQGDGSTAVSAQVNVRVKVLLKVYTYTYRGTETWKDGRLLALDSNCNDEGKQFTVSAAAGEKGLTVRVNGQEEVMPADVWTTSFWQLPPKAQRNHDLSLLDVDCGRQIPVRLDYAGSQAIVGADQTQKAARYRVSGGKQADLWYDAQERLIRQESIEDGHRMTVMLVRARK